MNRLTTEDFIEKAKAIHGNKYDYFYSVYVTAKEKIMIKCPKHGIFLQTPDGHLQGRGCKDCALEIKRNYKHGLSNDPLYRVWKSMMRRCNDKKWKSAYKYEGIEVSKNLSDIHYFFEYAKTIEGYDKFLSDGWTLDRIDTYKGYEEGNIRFADYSTQSINQKLRKNNKTGYVGIFICGNGYSASVEHNGLIKTKKTFQNIADAIQWRNEVIISNNLPNKLNTYQNAKT